MVYLYNNNSGNNSSNDKNSDGNKLPVVNKKNAFIPAKEDFDINNDVEIIQYDKTLYIKKSNDNI